MEETKTGEAPRSLVGFLLTLAFIVVVISMLAVYWFVPFNSVQFEVKSGNYNFTVGNESKGIIQFYPNMRFPSPMISYRIDNCPLQKKNDMERAFEIIENKTSLTFYPVTSNEEISVTCDSKNKIEGGLFIAGEGGPTNITRSGEYNVILHGTILLIRQSECERPNVAIHELLHVLGFAHSSNPNNIMYEVSRCNQVIGDDTIELLNNLYAIPSYPDLAFENVSAKMNGKYLDANISVRNIGLRRAGSAKIGIYADGEFAKSINLDSLDVGYGKVILLRNTLILKSNIKELSFIIDYSGNELKKENNKIVLEVSQQN